MTTRDEQAASAVAGVLYLVQMDFAFGSRYYTNWSHDIAWAGQTWQALGVALSVAPVQETETLQYPSMDIGMSLGNPGLLALAVNGAENYRRKPVTVWTAILDDELRPLGDPELYWAGQMDQLRLKTGNGEGERSEMTMRCEQPGRDGRNAQSLRLSHAQQRARFPTDTGLSRLEALIAQPSVWLSKRFQQVN